MEWISVKDRLPNDSQWCLAFARIFYSSINPEWSPCVACYYADPKIGENWQPEATFISGREYELDAIFVSHWMPLPEPPTPETKP